MSDNRLDESALAAARTLFDYERVDDPLERRDVAIGFGNHSEYVARRAAELYLEGLVDKVLFTGGFGRITRKIWNVPEAERFARVAERMGVREKDILLDTTSTNTGENISHSRRLLAKEQMLAQANAEIADKTALLLAERQQKSEIGQRLRQVSGVMRKINALKSKDCGEAVKLSREDIYDLALILNQTNDNFAERLRKKHPDLSDNDYGLCLMTKLGISNKGMSLLLDTTEAAVRKRKSRLKNDRLQVDGFETLEEYVESI